MSYVPKAHRNWWEDGYQGPVITNDHVDAFPMPPDDFQPTIRHEPDDRTANTIIIAADAGLEVAGVIVGEHREPNDIERTRLRKGLWEALQKSGKASTKH